MGHKFHEVCECLTGPFVRQALFIARLTLITVMVPRSVEITFGCHIRHEADSLLIG